MVLKSLIGHECPEQQEGKVRWRTSKNRRSKTEQIAEPRSRRTKKQKNQAEKQIK